MISVLAVLDVHHKLFGHTNTIRLMTDNSNLYGPTLKLMLCLLLLITVGCVVDSQQSKPPNILFVISDDQSYFHTSFAGCTYVSTPAFDRIATEGIYFTNCYAASPGCAPSRSALVTGRHHWQNEQSGQHASSWLKKYIPFVDELKANGYAVGVTGKGVGPFRYASNEDDSLWRTENAAGPLYSDIKYDENNDDRFASGIDKTNYAENFKRFIAKDKGDKPFFFWFGAKEPHRGYEKGSWKKMGKHLADVDVPQFLPDNDEIRGDLLDYAVEIEWFDLHLQRILDYLEEINELDNTIVIVTADNGMPFPRAKANCYEYGTHVPLAIRYPKKIQSGRISNTPIGFIEIAPTILEASQTAPKMMMPMTGKSIWSVLMSEDKEDSEKAVFSGRERHSSSRYLNWGYPQRSIRKGDYLFIWNITPERWPAGAPQKFDVKDTTTLLPLYGLNESGDYLSKSAFTDIDDCPSKTYLIENRKDEEMARYLNLSTAKRPEFELYNISSDIACLHNLADKQNYASVEEDLKAKLMQELRRTKDPRMDAHTFGVFDTYLRYSAMRKFPKPAHLAGQ